MTDLIKNVRMTKNDLIADVEYLLSRLKLTDPSSYYCDTEALKIEGKILKMTGEIPPN